ncbi:hypothetical protein GmHk_15G043931 [Glycine max]|nr:hypothetical protein GmHk_15G043931 [Glycine max]
MAPSSASVFLVDKRLFWGFDDDRNNTVVITFFVVVIVPLASIVKPLLLMSDEIILILHHNDKFIQNANGTLKYVDCEFVSEKKLKHIWLMSYTPRIVQSSS